VLFAESAATHQLLNLRKEIAQVGNSKYLEVPKEKEEGCDERANHLGR